MTPQEFRLVAKMLKERSGLTLGEDKHDFVESRLRPLMKALDCGSMATFIAALTKPTAEALRVRAAQAVSVQETYFFRDKVPFAAVADVMLPKLMRERSASRRLRIWSAAAATGQEPYSLAMLLHENGAMLDGWQVEIIATDFCEEALAKARRGIYTQFEVQRGLSITRLVAFFKKAGGGWELSPRVRSMVEFRPHNLLSNGAVSGMFDIIFCRNVLIYFDESTKRQVLRRLAYHLAPDGYLVLGSAETTTGLSSDFSPMGEAYHGIFTPAVETARTRLDQSIGSFGVGGEIGGWKLRPGAQAAAVF